jgi:uncharacterized protein YndB with AHSA1/START domain
VTIHPIRHAVTVDLPAGDAFALFTDGLGTWWPQDYSWSGAVLEAIGIEPALGGKAYERGPYGMRLDWGRVLAWEPPGRLVFSWQIAPDRVPDPNPAHGSEVEVRFRESVPGTTSVELEHRGFERHGEDGAGYRDALAAPVGWPRILQGYVAKARRREAAPWEGLTT